MRLSALGPEATADIPMRASLDLGVGEVFIAVTLIYLLAYLNLVDPMSISADTKREIRALLIASTIPLFLVFLSVVLINSLEILGYL